MWHYANVQFSEDNGFLAITYYNCSLYTNSVKLPQYALISKTVGLMGTLDRGN